MPTSATDKAAFRFFLLLLAAAAVLLAAVVRPLASPLFLAAVLAGVLWPLQIGLTRRVGKHRAIAAGALVVAVVLLLVGPLVALSTVVVKEAADGLRFLLETVRSEGVAGLLEKLPPSIHHLVDRGIQALPREPDASLDETIQKQVSARGGTAAAAVGAAVAATGSLVVQAVMMLIALYFLLIDGDALVDWIDGVSPLRRGQTRELMTEFKKVSYAVIVSTVITAGVQALAALIGYFIARVPHPIFFAGLTFLVAFIPAVGAASVCLAAALLIYATGHPYMAIFLALWGFLVVGLVDNVVKPLLVRSGMQMRGAVVFFALVGGLGAFGTVGLLIGPLAVAFFLALLRIYQRDFRAA
jgi:predicted PurR-regulated permease PerM